ncbi:MAG: helix-turn-helix transcriptional regulator [Clostridia bacterium]|nr:helix-turn-helix transcriptional regulator [Clostridia bacterium]
MNTLERILELAKNNNMTANKLLVECKLPSNSISYWKQGIKKPGIDALIKIADYFNVSIDYLVGRETPTTNEETNTANKAVNSTLLSRIESLDELQQAKVMAYIDGLQDTKSDSIIAQAVERGIANKQKDKTKIG